MRDLVLGWGKACDMSGASWGGGETPSLNNVVIDNRVDLAGCCVGFIKPKSRLSLGKKLKAGDRIIIFESSGIHANGISMARKIADSLPKKYATKLLDGKTYGEHILRPTIIYAKLIEDIFKAKVDIHYMVNVTGHGWRKIMRHKGIFTYRISKTPPVHELFTYMMKHGPIDEKEAYGSMNMGAGFVIYIPKKDVKKVLRISKKHKIKAYDAGIVEKGPKQVIIEPKNIIFEGESLKVRA
jgi:phosphoribosylformylglycinamidine cyclo-ligase